MTDKALRKRRKEIIIYEEWEQLQEEKTYSCKMIKEKKIVWERKRINEWKMSVNEGKRWSEGFAWTGSGWIPREGRFLTKSRPGRR